MFVVGTGLRERLMLICGRLRGISSRKWANPARSGASEVFQRSVRVSNLSML